jgi:hypothetical protein
MTRLATMAVDKIKNFTIETGEEMLYYQSGSLKIARTPARLVLPANSKLNADE